VKGESSAGGESQALQHRSGRSEDRPLRNAWVFQRQLLRGGRWPDSRSGL